MRRASRRHSRAGFGLIEVLVALVVVAVGVTALQRLVTRSVATLGEDLRLTRAMLAAQALLADAALAPPEPGRTDGTTPDGLRFERAVTRAPTSGAARDPGPRVAGRGRGPVRAVGGDPCPAGVSAASRCSGWSRR